MKHIVLTTDLSSASQSAFAPVGALAAKLEAKLTVLHIMPEQGGLPIGYPYIPATTGEQVEAYRADAQACLDRSIEELPPEVESSTALVETSERVDRAVCDWARDNNADAIAMATHGYSGFRRLLLGSVAENVLRAATIPVLLFPVASE